MIKTEKHNFIFSWIYGNVKCYEFSGWHEKSSLSLELFPFFISNLIFTLIEGNDILHKVWHSKSSITLTLFFHGSNKVWCYKYSIFDIHTRINFNKLHHSWFVRKSTTKSTTLFVFNFFFHQTFVLCFIHWVLFCYLLWMNLIL